eukprot:bmy_17084T0
MTSASIFVTPALGGGPEGAAPPTPPETPPSLRSAAADWGRACVLQVGTVAVLQFRRNEKDAPAFRVTAVGRAARCRARRRLPTRSPSLREPAARASCATLPGPSAGGRVPGPCGSAAGGGWAAGASGKEGTPLLPQLREPIPAASVPPAAPAAGSDPPAQRQAGGAEGRRPGSPGRPGLRTLRSRLCGKTSLRVAESHLRLPGPERSGVHWTGSEE